jgi:hypothetical protein
MFRPLHRLLYSSLNFVTAPLSVDTNNNTRVVSNREKVSGYASDTGTSQRALKPHHLDLRARLPGTVRHGVSAALKVQLNG